MSVPVVVAGADVADLVRGLDAAGCGVRVVRRCAAVAEAVSTVEAGLAAALLLVPGHDRFDREVLRRLHRAGVAVVALVGPAGGPRREDLLGMGLTRVLPAGTPPGDVAGEVRTAVEQARRGPREGSPAPPGGGGRLVAVWGPTGAPGRTTVAVTVAMDLAATGHRVLLVDADTYGASVAQVLALPDETSGLAAAVRAALRSGLGPELLSRLAPLAAPRLRVLTGLPRACRWPELRASGLETVWEVARRLAAFTVVDCGFALDADEELQDDVVGPRRNEATSSVLSAADSLVVVGSADPVGLRRLVEALEEVAAAVPCHRSPLVVVNRVRSSVAGPRPERSLRELLRRCAGVEGAFLVPDDPGACDAALLAGRGLPEHAPGSPARIALAALAGQLCECGRPPVREVPACLA